MGGAVSFGVPVIRRTPGHRLFQGAGDILRNIGVGVFIDGNARSRVGHMQVQQSVYQPKFPQQASYLAVNVYKLGVQAGFHSKGIHG